MGSIGINFQSDFDDKDIIRDRVADRVSEMVKQGYTSGELCGEEPDFEGWWTIDIKEDDEDDNDEDIKLEEISRLIKNGCSPGYCPTFSWKANVW